MPLARPIGERLADDQVEEALKIACRLREQELGVADAGRIVAPLLVFELGAGVDINARDLAEIGDSLDRQGVELLRLAHVLLELAEDRQAEPVAEPMFKLDNGGRLAAGRAPLELRAAYLDFGDAVHHIGIIDFLAQAGLG
jgi:hypothetical protein